eukprot:TRINITY_DN50953_c0_g1_i2.p1 TRINITY_DN50953_c0_g1~~TRINITY_DN50953_c0_g1_i2.p1  ORF type:complete len:377 (-),score=82.13 TRINITY_DN50953_c0_g1_i2:99-1229(-)
MCSARGLSNAGKKQEIIERLIAFSSPPAPVETPKATETATEVKKEEEKKEVKSTPSLTTPQTAPNKEKKPRVEPVVLTRIHFQPLAEMLHDLTVEERGGVIAKDAVRRTGTELFLGLESTFELLSWHYSRRVVDALLAFGSKVEDVKEEAKQRKKRERQKIEEEREAKRQKTKEEKESSPSNSKTATEETGGAQQQQGNQDTKEGEQPQQQTTKQESEEQKLQAEEEAAKKATDEQAGTADMEEDKKEEGEEQTGEGEDGQQQEDASQKPASEANEGEANKGEMTKVVQKTLDYETLQAFQFFDLLGNGTMQTEFAEKLLTIAAPEKGAWLLCKDAVKTIVQCCCKAPSDRSFKFEPLCQLDFDSWETYNAPLPYL